MPERWMVTVNGHPQFKDLDRGEAEQRATKWGWGMGKHKDPKSHSIWVEIKRDKQSEREFDDEYRLFKEGKPQRYDYIYGVKD